MQSEEKQLDLSGYSLVCQSLLVSLQLVNLKSSGHKFSSWENPPHNALGVTPYAGVRPSSKHYQESLEVEKQTKKSLKHALDVFQLPLGNFSTSQ